MAQDKRIAVVYDWFDKWGGVERLLLTLSEIFPQAVFYTSYYDDKKAQWAKDLQIKTSFIQKLPEFIKKSRILSLPFYPYAFESFDFSSFEVVISVTSSFAKAVITKPATIHICYLLTPTRFLWLRPDLYQNKLVKSLGSCYVKSLCQWDFISAQRPDRIISISRTVSDRCQKYYKRKSEVIYPPFDLEYWKNIKYQILNSKDTYQIAKIIKHKYFLIVSRLEPYKKVDLAIAVFNKLPAENLIIVGKGSEKKKLQQIANRNIRFFEDLTDQELGYLYSNAVALIMSQEEDFGYTALESQFFGCPVIAYNKGGASETIVDSKTGIFFTDQTERSFLQALERFHTISYNLKNSTKINGLENISSFSEDKFKKSFKTIINY